MTDRELMQMALDVLEDINQCSLPPTGVPLPAEIDHVMETLRARLAQPERAWQGLTNDEVNELSHLMVKEDKSVNWLTYAIEAKLKEKNI